MILPILFIVVFGFIYLLSEMRSLFARFIGNRLIKFVGLTYKRPNHALTTKKLQGFLQAVKNELIW
jgi:hypothetical protein